RQAAVPASPAAEIRGRAVHVTVRGGDDRPVAGITVRLRSAVTGRAEGAAATDVAGVTVFRDVPTGHYVAEALADAGRVLATSPLFEIAAGEVVVTMIRLPTKPGGLAALFGSVAAAAISAATALGVTAAAPTGQPVSPRR
ncbi:MAG TPA: carboxypeptidase-like regulatory domain-containing protein, partial [Vicinamibacterales bacterium]|nr:carboxypeptidase-like regulatory domain-containing protein [Vicinamibacterales bacterium]